MISGMIGTDIKIVVKADAPLAYVGALSHDKKRTADAVLGETAVIFNSLYIRRRSDSAIFFSKHWRNFDHPTRGRV